MLDPLSDIKCPLNPRNGPPGNRCYLEFAPGDVKAIRNCFDATQVQFARLIGISVETLRNWEKGRRRPHGPARALLRAVAADPEALSQALNWNRVAWKVEPSDP